jgi:hypothetical protein
MRVNPNYKCTQQQLYAVANLGWQNYLDNLADFTNHKAKYTEEFGTNEIAAVLAAKKLPDIQARGSVPESIRIELTEAAAVCADNWRKLKTYINDAFSEAQQKPKLQSAGSKFYKRASSEGWEQMNSMLTSASQFIENNLESLLQAGTNMPATFPAKFEADKAAFETKYAAFLSAQQDSIGGTSIKMTTNNQVYDSLMKMFVDGQAIYRNDPVNKSLFVFESLLGFVASGGVTGLRIVAKERVTQLPVAGFAVTVQPGNMQGRTDENGVLVLPITEDTYSIQGIKDGYESFVEEVNITTGVVSRKNVLLTKMA